MWTLLLSLVRRLTLPVLLIQAPALSACSPSKEAPLVRVEIFFVEWMTLTNISLDEHAVRQGFDGWRSTKDKGVLRGIHQKLRLDEFENAGEPRSIDVRLILEIYYADQTPDIIVASRGEICTLNLLSCRENDDEFMHLVDEVMRDHLRNW